MKFTHFALIGLRSFGVQLLFQAVRHSNLKAEQQLNHYSCWCSIEVSLGSWTRRDTRWKNEKDLSNSSLDFSFFYCNF